MAAGLPPEVAPSGADRRPFHAADVRLELARGWGPGGRLLDGTTGRCGPAAARYTARWAQVALAGADLWWLPAATCQLLDRVYRSVPDDLVLDAASWQQPKTLVVFEEPVDGRTAMLAAPRDISRGAWGTFPATAIATFDADLDQTGPTHWPLAEPLGITRIDPDANVDDRRLMASLWLFDTQRAIVVESEPLPTLTQLRVQRAGFHTRPVRILRIAAPATTERGGRPRSGHVRSPRWRRVCYGPHHSLSKLVLVGAH